MDAAATSAPHGEPPERGRDRRGSAAVFLLGVGLAWSAGNVGPAVGELRADFGISLTAVGVLSGTLLYAAMVVGIAIAPRVAEQVGLIRGMLLACALGGVGGLTFAFASSFAMLAAGRVLAGLGLGLAGVLGPVFARATGGVARVGVFGGAFQLGIAGGLGAGSLLADLGVDWRIGFAISAAVAVAAVPMLRGERVEVELEGGHRGFLRAALRSPKALRLGLLFTAMFAVPLTLGAWLVHYATEDGGLRVAVAGALAFVLFGVSAAMREVGGRLARRGASPVLLAGLAPWLATAGLLAIALDPSLPVFAVAVVAMGAGFALPYAVMMTEAQRLFPPEPAQPTALLTVCGTALAIATIPLLGSLLAAGHGPLGLAALAILVAIAGLANLRPVAGAIEPLG